MGVSTSRGRKAIVAVRRRPTLRGVVLQVALYGILGLAAILSLLPLYLALIFSSYSVSEIFSWPPHLTPGPALADNLRILQGFVPIARNFLNSVLVAGSQTFLVLVTSSLAGFAFAKHRFPGRDALFTLMLLVIFLPAWAGIVPWFLLIRYLGWINTYPGLIVPGAVSAFGVFWIRQYIADGVPDELLDAARIDGAGEYRIWLQVVVPIIRPALGALAIMQFLGAWNSFLGPLLIAQGQDMFTLPVAIRVVQGALMGGVQQWGAILLGADIGTVPILIVFLLATRQFISSLAVGAVKG